jgi:hypothetical protein
MQKWLIGLILGIFVAVSAGAVTSQDAEAGAVLAGKLSGAVEHQSLVEPVLVWRDCQRIARCHGCRPVFRCRSCTYQRQCPSRRRPCEWSDVCVWGPYLPVAPRGVPVY